MSARMVTCWALLTAASAVAQVLGPPHWVDSSTTAQSPLAGDQVAHDAAPAGARTFVVWQDFRGSKSWPDIYGAFIDEAGQWSPSTGFPISAGALGDFRPSVCCSATQCLVTWDNALSGLQAARFDLSGARLDPVPRSLYGLYSEYETHCAAGASGFLVEWARGSLGAVDAVLVAADGTVGPRFGIGTLTAYNDESEVAWNGSTYGVVWRRNTPAILLATVTEAGAVSAEATVVADDGQQPRIVAEGSGWAVIWGLRTATYVYVGPFQGRRIAQNGTLGPVTSLGSDIASFHTALAHGTTTLVAWRKEGGSYSQFVAPWPVNGGLGAAVEVGPQVASSTPRPVLSVVDGGVLHLSTDSRSYADFDLSAVQLDAQGQPRSPLTSPGRSAAWHRAPTVARHGAGLVAAWEGPASLPDAGGTELRVAPLGLGGAPLGPSQVVATGPQFLSSPLLIPGLDVTALAWVQKPNIYTTDVWLHYALLDASLTPGAPTLLNPGGCCVQNLMGVPMADATWLLYTDYGSSTPWLRGMRIARDGGLLDVPRRLLSDGLGGDYAAAWAPDAGVLLVVVANNGLPARRFAGDGTSLDSSWVALDAGTYPAKPAVASSGRDFLVAWVENGDVVRVVRVDGVTGRMAGPVRDLNVWNPSSWGDVAVPSLVFDGRDYLLALDTWSADGGQDVLLARLDDTGALLDAQPLAVGPGEQADFSLVVVGPGRTASAGLSVDPAVGVLRTSVRVRAAIPAGGQCLADSECLVGACVVGRCCDPSAAGCAGPTDAGTADDGGVRLDGGDVSDGGAGDDGGARVDAGEAPDGGGAAADAGSASDAGEGLPDGGVDQRPWTVGCGCASLDASALTGLLLLGLLRRRRQGGATSFRVVATSRK